MNDTQLLQNFVNEGSETAFRGLVERHLPLVLGTARRLTNDSSLAEDVAQTVFILLARKARSFSDTAIVPSWLYRTTCFVAKRAMTSEKRRRSREEEAVLMQEQNTDVDSAWEQVSPWIDEALQCLGETDRAAILLRYMDQQPVREVGLELGLSEEAARKRVARALDKLRTMLKRRGVEVSAAVLIVGLSQRATHAAPVATVALISRTAVGTAAGTTAASVLLLEVLSAWRWANLKALFLGGAATALLLTTLAVLPSVRHWFTSMNNYSQGNSSGTNQAAESPWKRKGAGKNSHASDDLLNTNDLRHIQITVRDAETHEPMEGAEIVQQTLHLPNLSEQLRSDSNGVAKIALPRTFPIAEYMTQFPVGIKAKDYAPREIMWLSSTGSVLATITNDYTVQLEHGVTLGGTVVDEAGQPVVGIHLEVRSSNYRGYSISTSGGKITSPPDVRVEDYSDYSLSASATNASPIVTDDAGHFSLTHFPSDLHQIEIVLCAEDGNRFKFQTARAEIITEFPATEVSYDDLRRGSARLVVKRGENVEGMVVDSDGMPVAGARVLEATQWGNLRVQSTNVTDTAGRFHLPNRPSREYIFSASKEGYGSASTTVAVRSGMQPVVVTLPPEMPLRGRVVNESGQPQTDVKINVSDYLNEGFGFVWSGTTDNEGRFVWHAAPTNELRFAVSGSGGFKFVRMAASTNEHLITLRDRPSEVEATGKVFDAETGTPISKFTVGISHGVLGGVPEAPDSTITGSDGAFALKMHSSDFLPNQQPAWTLQVEADGYQPCLGQTFEFGEGDQTLEFAMRRVVTMRGKVTTPEGELASRATLEFALTNEAIFSFQPGSFGARYASATTDAQGNFKINAPLRAEALGIFHSSGWTLLPISASAEEINVTLQRWGRIEGTLLLGGVPATNQTIGLEKLIWDLADRFNIHYETKTDGEGHFTFEQVPAGEFELSLRSDEWRDFNGSELGTQQTPVVVQAGETAKVTMAAAGASFSMRVRAPAGIAVSTLENAVATLAVDVNLPRQPQRDDYVTEASHHAARLAYPHDPVVLAAKRQMRAYGGHITREGVVRFDNIPPGSYVFEVTLFRKLVHGSRRAGDGKPEAIAKLRTGVSVPEASQQDGGEPVSLGDFTLEPL